MAEDLEIKLRDVRLSFANLFKAKVYRNKKTQEIESFSEEAAFLLDKDNPAHVETIKAVSKAIKDAIEAKWPGQKMTIPLERRCARPGEMEDPDEPGVKVARYEGYDNKVVINAKKRIDASLVNEKGEFLPNVANPVQLLGPRKTAKDSNGKAIFPRLKQGDGMLYSGCYVDAIIRIYAYDGTKDGNPNRVNASLEAVKFVRHGEAFGAKQIDADAAFDEEEGDEDDDIMGTDSKPSVPDDDDDLMS